VPTPCTCTQLSPPTQTVLLLPSVRAAPSNSVFSQSEASPPTSSSFSYGGTVLPMSIVARKSRCTSRLRRAPRFELIFAALGGLSDRCPRGFLLVLPRRYLKRWFPVCLALRRSHHHHCADGRLLVTWRRYPGFPIVRPARQSYRRLARSPVRVSQTTCDMLVGAGYATAAWWILGVTMIAIFYVNRKGE